MKKYLAILLLFLSVTNIFSQLKTIHVFVALCDNEHQGIIPVPEILGNGKDPGNNLYWGAAYGIKNYFNNRTDDWIFLGSINPESQIILERIIFKHSNSDVYLLADAYDGAKIQHCIEDFLRASNRQIPTFIDYDNNELKFGGNSDMLVYIGHNGLMDFQIEIDYHDIPTEPADVIILACSSRNYFYSHMANAQANPILWTTNLIAPEAYTLKAAINSWIMERTGEEIKEEAAQMYNRYQRCGINSARQLFSSGF